MPWQVCNRTVHHTHTNITTNALLFIARLQHCVLLHKWMYIFAIRHYCVLTLGKLYKFVLNSIAKYILVLYSKCSEGCNLISGHNSIAYREQWRISHLIVFIWNYLMEIMINYRVNSWFIFELSFAAYIITVFKMDMELYVYSKNGEWLRDWAERGSNDWCRQFNTNNIRRSRNK